MVCQAVAVMTFWDKSGDLLNTKYPYVCHAELNAILNNIGMDLTGCRIYTALFPCNECSKAIIQSGIKEVIYLSDKYDGTDVSKASKRMLDAAGITYRKVEVKGKKHRIIIRRKRCLRIYHNHCSLTQPLFLCCFNNDRRYGRTTIGK